jgi:hypothetical protein
LYFNSRNLVFGAVVAARGVIRNANHGNISEKERNNRRHAHRLKDKKMSCKPVRYLLHKTDCHARKDVRIRRRNIF